MLLICNINFNNKLRLFCLEQLNSVSWYQNCFFLRRQLTRIRGFENMEREDYEF